MHIVGTDRHISVAQGANAVSCFIHVMAAGVLIGERDITCLAAIWRLVSVHCIGVQLDRAAIC
jgi:hypothetical protein